MSKRSIDLGDVFTFLVGVAALSLYITSTFFDGQIHHNLIHAVGVLVLVFILCVILL